MQRILTNYGLVSAAIMGVLMAVQYLLVGIEGANFNLLELLGYSIIVLSLSVVFWAIRKYREQNGGVTFLQGLQIGTGVSFISSAILGIITWFMLKFVTTDMMDKLKDHYTQQVRSIPNQSAEKTQQMLQELNTQFESMQDPAIQGLMMFATAFVIGIILTVIAAAILRRGRPLAV
jgi:hypothetical protein